MTVRVFLTRKRTILGVAKRLESLIFWCFVPLLLIPVIFIRTISPYYRIRLKEIFSSRLGHFSSEPDLYLARRMVDGIPEKTLDVFGFDEKRVCNRQLAKMWSRKILFIPFLRHIKRVNNFFPGWQCYEVPWNDAQNQDVMSITEHSFLEFTDEERERGERILRKITGSNIRPIVCVFNRDSQYLNTQHTYRDWKYHDYRDSNIDNYLPAMEWLAEQGYTVMRMGSAVAQPIGKYSENVIDYATHHRSDFMDVYLFGMCDFFVGSTTGPASLGGAFRKSAAHVNASPFLTFDKVLAVSNNELFIPKMYRYISNRKFLSIDHIVSHKIHNLGLSSEFIENDVEIIENDSTDILNIAKEIEGLVTGKLTLSEDDVHLQREFWKTARIDSQEAQHYPQPSPAFLRRHKDILFK